MSRETRAPQTGDPDLDRIAARTIERDRYPYLIYCPECRRTLPRKVNSKPVKLARQGKQTCEECGGEVELIRDDVGDEPSYRFEEGALEDDDGDEFGKPDPWRAEGSE